MDNMEKLRRETEPDKTEEVVKFNAYHIGIVVLTTIIIIIGGIIAIWVL